VRIARTTETGAILMLLLLVLVLVPVLVLTAMRFDISFE
jgi:hypothetical protein